MAADGSIILDTRINTSGFDALSSSISGLPKALGKIGKAIGAAFAIGSITQFSKEAIQLGSDLQEVQNVVDVTFGNMNSAIEKFAQTAAEQFGLSELSAKQYTSTIGAMLKSMGFTAEQAAEMSMELAGLAGDMASFYNLETDEAFYKLRSGISGETEPLKQLGINLSVANLEQYAFAQGIEKSYNAMTQQEQALLRYNYLLSVTSDAQGDFSRTSSSWANQTRILSLQFETLKATIGQGLINALTPVIQVINTILSGLQAVARAFQQFTALLFGNAAGSSGVSNQIQDIADGYGAAAGGAEDLAEGTKKAGQEAKRYLSSFDEITKLNDLSSASGGGGSGGTGGGAGGLGNFGGLTADANIQDNISPKIEALVNKIKELIAPLQEIDFTPLKESLAKLGDSFRNLGSTVGDALEWAWYNILVPLAQWSIEELAPALIDRLAATFDYLNTVLESLEPVATFLWENFLQPLGEWTGDLFIQAMSEITDLLTDLESLISGETSFGEFLSNLTPAQTALASVSASFAAIATSMGIISGLSALKDLGTFFSQIQNLTASGTIGKLGEVIAIVASGAGNLHEAMNLIFGPGSIIAGVGALIGGLVGTVTNFMSMLENGFSWINEALMLVGVTIAAVGAIILGAPALVTGVIAAISAVVLTLVVVVKEHWAEIQNALTNVLENIKKAWNNVAEWFSSNVIQPIVNFFSQMGNEILGIWNKIISWITEAISDVVGFFNNVFGGGSATQSYSEEPSIAAYSVTPEVPHLAKGAVLPANKPFLAVLGDQSHGRNLEAPEDLIRQIVREESGAGNSDRLAQLLETLIAVVEGIEVGDEVIGKAAARYNRNTARARGW